MVPQESLAVLPDLVEALFLSHLAVKDKVTLVRRAESDLANAKKTCQDLGQDLANLLISAGSCCVVSPDTRKKYTVNVAKNGVVVGEFTDIVI